MKIPDNISLETNGQYCIKCFSGPVQRIYKNNLTFYKCSACGKTSERSLVIDQNVTSWIDKKGNYWHESVGVLVMNKDKKILCMLRQIFPFASTIPAGHLDKNENPENAAMRELEEETNIKTDSKPEKIATFNIPGDSCRRGSDHHKWNLYKLKIENSEKIKLSDETSEVHWYSLEELKKMDNLTFALNFILKKFGGSLIL
jgi:8-oxo-dGTP pyrophosphatase MutT (NUDIX family)